MPSACPIPQSAGPGAAAAAFTATLGCWVTACLRRHQQAPATLVHDQGTFTLSRAPWLAAGDGATARAWLLEYRDRIHARSVEDGIWRHGYWREQEVHHGT